MRRSISLRVMAMARTSSSLLRRGHRNETSSHVNTEVSIPDRRQISLEVDQLGPFAHLLAGGDAERLDRAGARRADRVLHLHRLEDEERRALLDGGPGRGDERDHLARHRRDEPGALLVVLGAADAEQVDERKRVRTTADEDVPAVAARDDRGGEAPLAE